MPANGCSAVLVHTLLLWISLVLFTINCMSTNPIPEGYSTITPYLVVADALAAFEFLVRAFDATEIRRSPLPDGTVFNMEARIGNSMVMVVQRRPDHDMRPMALYLYVPVVDLVYEKALAAGARSLLVPADQFYRDRCAGVQDPAGNTWWIASRIEDLTSAEVGERIRSMAAPSR